MISLEVIDEICFKCGACASLCPLNLIYVYDSSVKVEEGCTDCGMCADVCPVEAIDIEKQV
ncbi:MAG: indolepyruvate ferredoxin oxidoreductase subunit alpha [Candidatus Hadarchaeota archaeon]